MKIGIVLFAAFGALALPQDGARPSAGAEGRVLRSEVVVDGPAEDAFRAFVEPERMLRWMGVKRAEVDLRVGGTMRTSYADEDLGGPGTIVNRILSYEPGRMLSIRNEKAPAGSGLDAFRDVWSVIRFEPLAGGRTRVVVSGLGYGEGPEWDRIYEHFERGNAWTLQQLRRHLSGSGAAVAPPAELLQPATSASFEAAGKPVLRELWSPSGPDRWRVTVGAPSAEGFASVLFDVEFTRSDR